jgi:HEAT repeat protein
MTESDHPLAPETLTELLDDEDRSATVSYLQRLQTSNPDTRKRSLRAIKEVAADSPSLLVELGEPCATFLTDDNRAVRLTTAKLFVTLARSHPEIVRPVVEDLAARLADDEEFYYVRARCAEALGYLGREYPETVDDPEILADLRIGLAFDEPEVKEKLAKALECVALGNPDRLRHHVSSLAEYLDDDSAIVRYHLTTTLLCVGIDAPDRLVDATSALVARLDDENTVVQGRAAEALGVLARGSTDEQWSFESALRETTEADRFLADRCRFALWELGEGTDSSEPPGTIGTFDGIRDTTRQAVEEIRAPDSTTECPHCGLTAPEEGPPLCPGCGHPY